MSEIGENIKRYRKAKGLSQVKLAEAIGETKQTIWKYESGTVTNIPLAKVEALAAALSCEPSQLLGWEPEKQKNLEIAAEESAPYLTREEAELIEKFQVLSRENQDKLLQEIQSLLNEQNKKDL